jgi:hypothetical protein
MINKTKKEIECDFLERLLMAYGYFNDVINALMEDKLMTQADVNSLKKEGSGSIKFLYEFLKKLQSEDKLSLLYFEWEMLPEERCRLTLGTHMRVREFKHNY